MPRGAKTLEMPMGATGARIAGFLGHDADAWPGRKAATIQIAGCPMRCPFCNTPELITTSHESGATLADILAYLDRTDADGVVVSGGEPTCDPAVLDLLRALCAEGVPVKLDTSGIAPGVISAVVDEGLADFVALDIKATPQRYEAVTGLMSAWHAVAESVATLIASNLEHEFRVTCYPLTVSLSDLSTIAKELVGGRRLVLQQFRAQHTLDAAARTVAPYPTSELLRAVDRCNPYIATVVRGA